MLTRGDDDRHRGCPASLGLSFEEGQRVVSKEDTLRLAVSQIDHSQCEQTVGTDRAKQFLDKKRKEIERQPPNYYLFHGPWSGIGFALSRGMSLSQHSIQIIDWIFRRHLSNSNYSQSLLPPHVSLCPSAFLAIAEAFCTYAKHGLQCSADEEGQLENRPRCTQV